MTKEELREHCEKQVKMCEEWAKGNDREPSGKIYEEHKLILDLIKALEQNEVLQKENEDFRNYIDKANYTNSQLIQLIEKHKMNRDTSDDCVSRQAIADAVENTIAKYIPIFLGRYEKIPLELALTIRGVPPVTPTHGTCKDCKHLKDSDGVYRRGIGAESKCPINIKEVYEGNFYCKDFKRRVSEK